jgi:hypothetical protein
VTPPEPYWSDDRVTLYLGDCLDVLGGLEPGSVDAIVTDPPAAVSFMGREWDSDRGGRDQWISWLAGRMEAAAVCLKPGGHALVWSLPRTAHWTAMAVEDAGLEIRDCIPHLFGSGFPKSLDVSKAIDRARNDRPAILRVTSWLADIADAKGITRAQVDSYMGTSDMGGWWLSRLQHRCAVPTWDQWLRLRDLLGFGDEMDAEVWRLNGRKGTPGEAWDQREITQQGVGKHAPGDVIGWDQRASKDRERRDIPATEDAVRWEGWGTALKPGQELWWLARKPIRGTVAASVLAHGTGALNIDGCSTSGRWPPNVVFTHSASCEQEAWACAADCPVAELDRQSGVSRFFPVFRYEAKAPAHERPKLPDGTAWPTVKPVDLMSWLVRLITPPGGVVLDPFAGTGTTGEACLVEGFRCVLIERDPVAVELMRTRLRKPVQPVMFGESA